jgi:hypothetical protein
MPGDSGGIIIGAPKDSAIKSGKVFLIKIGGEMPVGMTPEQLGILIQHGLSFSTALHKIAADMTVEIGEAQLGSQQ